MQVAQEGPEVWATPTAAGRSIFRNVAELLDVRKMGSATGGRGEQELCRLMGTAEAAAADECRGSDQIHPMGGKDLPESGTVGTGHRDPVGRQSRIRQTLTRRHKRMRLIMRACDLPQMIRTGLAVPDHDQCDVTHPSVDCEANFLSLSSPNDPNLTA